MSLTVRLSARTERALNAMARRRRQTRSDIVREAIERYTSTAERVGEESQLDAWADVIGTVRTAGRPRTKTTGEAFTELVHRKARARRAR